MDCWPSQVLDDDAAFAGRCRRTAAASGRAARRRAGRRPRSGPRRTPSPAPGGGVFCPRVVFLQPRAVERVLGEHALVVDGEFVHPHGIVDDGDHRRPSAAQADVADRVLEEFADLGGVGERRTLSPKKAFESATAAAGAAAGIGPRRPDVSGSFWISGCRQP